MNEYANVTQDFEPMCVRCPYIDVQTQTQVLYAGGKPEVVSVNITCKTIEQCRRAKGEQA